MFAQKKHKIFLCFDIRLFILQRTYFGVVSISLPNDKIDFSFFIHSIENNRVKQNSEIYQKKIILINRILNFHGRDMRFQRKHL